MDLDAAAFAAVVRDASEDGLEELMAAPERTEVLDGIFARAPRRLRRDRASGFHAIVHWQIAGRTDGIDDVYELVIRRATCVVFKPPASVPDAVVRVAGPAFLRLAVGATSALELLRAGALAIDGDVGLALRTEFLFERP